jgi:hypothetical protein
MKVVMRLEDQERKLDLATMPIKDAAECERLTGLTWTEWREQLAQDRASAIAFAWFLAGRREGHPAVKFSDIDIDLAKLRWDVELSDEEQALIDAGSAAEEDADSEIPTGPDEAETPAG